MEFSQIKECVFSVHFFALRTDGVQFCNTAPNAKYSFKILFICYLTDSYILNVLQGTSRQPVKWHLLSLVKNRLNKK